MEEEKKVKKTSTKTTKVETNANDDIIKSLQATILALSEELKSLKTQNNNVEQKKDEQKVLPKKVKVMSLMPTILNLTTEKDGQGKIFTFKDIGDIITMKTTELEEILSVQGYRTQAEQGYFYILDKDIVADQELEDFYERICNKQELENVINMTADDAVEKFCAFDENMQQAIAVKIAENMNEGMEVDLNKLRKISMKTDIDIIRVADSLKMAKKH